VFPAVQAAIAAGSKDVLRIIHFSVQVNHIHLMVEADDRRSLTLGVRGFSIRAARALNRRLGRRGAVWGDRYYARPLKSPRQVRHGLVYVLMNFKKHIPRARGLDPCSSAPWFDGFLAGNRLVSSEKSPVELPRTWLAAVGWRRYGLIQLHEAPEGATPPAAGTDYGPNQDLAHGHSEPGTIHA